MVFCKAFFFFSLYMYGFCLFGPLGHCMQNFHAFLYLLIYPLGSKMNIVNLCEFAFVREECMCLFGLP